MIKSWFWGRERLSRCDRAVVLAAGTGSRLVRAGEPPKPLQPMLGVPLLVRVLRTLESEGVREALIVVGHRGDEIETTLRRDARIGMRLSFVVNRDFNKKNGVSLLQAKKFIREGTLLTMADHLYSPELVRRLRAMELPTGHSALAVDFDVPRCFDIDDATKVLVEGGLIRAINKEMDGYNAIDTGVFRIGPSLIAELEALYERDGDCSLSDGVRALAQRGKFHACDVRRARWIDVDTAEAKAQAEALLRIFGDSLEDEVSPKADPRPVEHFVPTWVRAAEPYREDHFDIAARSEGVIRLMSNENPFSPSKRVQEAVLAALSGANLYPARAVDLRARLAEREGLTAPNVVLGAGSTELIDMLVRTFIAPGEEALIAVPTFSMYEARTRAAGGVPVLVPLGPSGELDVRAVLGAITERTKLLFLCDPNNPTGSRHSETEIRALLDAAIPTVVDEAYFEFSETQQSATRLMAEYPNLIVIRTFSKALGLAGLRLGYAFAHPSIIGMINRVRVPWNVSSIALAAGHAVLDDSQEQETRLALLKHGRAALSVGLGKIPGVHVMPSEGNFVLVDISATGVSASAFSQKMLDAGVFIRTLDVHHAGRSLVRVTVGSPGQNEACVRAARRALGERSTEVALDAIVADAE